MANRRWFYMTASTFANAQRACEELHARQVSNQALQVIWNSEMTACLVRLDGASKSWRAEQPWLEQCNEVYCRTEKPGSMMMQRLAGKVRASKTPPAPDDGGSSDWADAELWPEDMAAVED